MRIWQKYKITTRFSIAIGLVLVPFGLMMLYSLWGDEEQKEFVLAEIAGVRYHREVSACLEALQALRGQAARRQAGRLALTAENLKNLEQDLENKLLKLDAMQADYGSLLETGALHAKIRPSIKKAMESWSSLSASDAYDAFSVPGQHLLNMSDRIADSSNLQFDPEFETYYLMEVSIILLPAMLERLAVLRYKGEEDLLSEEQAHERFFLKTDVVIKNEEERLQIIISKLKNRQDLRLQGRIDFNSERKDIADFVSLISDVFVDKTRVVDASDLYLRGLKAMQSTNRILNGSHNLLEELLLERKNRIEQKELGFLVIMGLVIVVSMALQISISRSVTRPLQIFRWKLDELASAESDLTRRIEYAGNDELGQIAAAINHFIANLQELVLAIGVEAARVSNAVRDVSAAINLLGTTAQDMASSTEESAAAIEELTSSIDSVLGSVKHQNASMATANDNISALNQATENASEKMQGLSRLTVNSSEHSGRGRQSAVGLEAAMQSIQEKSQRIEEILALIDGISEQTSLLALNASIEAARAGEHGRGFAVVAEEISQLAEKTARNTRNIQELVRETGAAVLEGASRVRDATGTFAAMAESADEITFQTTQVKEQLQIIQSGSDQISASMQSVTRLATEIESASQEQSRGGTEINQAISSISTSADNLQKEVDRLNSSGNELLSVSEKLALLMRRFKVD